MVLNAQPSQTADIDMLTNFWQNARLVRLIVGVLMPPLLMAISYLLLNTWHGSFSMGIAISGLMLTQTFTTAGLQLLIYAVLMEFLVVPKLKNIHGVACVSGGLLLLTVVSAFLVFLGPTLTPFEHDRLTPVLGFIIGGLLGYGLKHHARQSRG
ncbi:MAG: hypothetical protein AAFY17_01015 [Cyanobacteria bacterium J06642_11]